MRWFLTLALLALVTWPAAAQENEAEKRFRDLEQKVRTAKTLQVRFDAVITGADAKKADDEKKVDAKKWHYKGSAILGEGDKFRWEYEGKRFGHEWKHTFVSDGTDKMGFGEYKQPGEDKANVRSKGTEKTPKAFGAHFRAALPRDGFVLGFTTDRNSQMPPDLFIMSDFKLAGEEKIGARDTQVIQYSVKTKARDPSFNPASTNVLSMKLWLDAKTKLPVKLAMTGGESDFSAITETYSEFTVDAKVDPKLFELPKGPAPKNDKGPEKEAKDADKPLPSKDKADLPGAIFKAPGSYTLDVRSRWTANSSPGRVPVKRWTCGMSPQARNCTR